MKAAKANPSGAFDPDEFWPGQTAFNEKQGLGKRKTRRGAGAGNGAAAGDETRAPEFSDESLALAFAEQHHDTLRYVSAWGRWYVYDGRRWAPDETLAYFDRARTICRAAAGRAGTKPSLAAAVASAKTVAAVIALARADRRLAASTDQWDTDSLLLNTPGGTIDLATGAARPHSAQDYLTKVTAVAPGISCPLWLKFLDRVSGGDAALIAFLQRVAGYSLTGLTREHALFFLYGTGANGKSVFISTIAGILGDYHRTAAVETFTASNGDRHPTDLAGLRGARLVTAIETEEGRRWAESRIKTLTGGDQISARFMRQDFFEYTPQFKLLIAGNHKPGLRSVDEAIRRRFHLIPFTVTIPLAERDDTLTERLRDEWPGVLSWTIEGCRQWQEIGLAPPAAVRDATTAYLENEDALSAWLSECCNRRGWAKTAFLFASWKTWAESSGEHPGTLKRFRDALETRNFRNIHKEIGSCFEGLSLRQTEGAQWPG